VELCRLVGDFGVSAEPIRRQSATQAMQARLNVKTTPGSNTFKMDLAQSYMSRSFEGSVRPSSKYLKIH
jgi:hypothetical protein